MRGNDASPRTAAGLPQRLSALNAGFFRLPRLRRILTLAGHEVRFGLPRPGDGVVVWGRSPTAWRAEAVAARRGAAVVRVEDAFLRSVRPGRSGDAPLGLIIDGEGVHFDATAPSAMERILSRDPLDDSHLLQRARDGIGRLKAADLSKYNNLRPDAPLPDPGYVLVIDQIRDDASVRHGGATDGTFREMLVAAAEAHPRHRILIKTHPETRAGLRPGHFTAAHAEGRIGLCDDAVSPWRLLEGAVAVYTVSSQMGFEAILAGHRPHVFGTPFYAGWGLTEDRQPLPRRGRSLTRAQIFAAAMILAPTWYDPCRDRLCSFEEAVDQLEAEVRAFREDGAGHVATGMRLWKRRAIQTMFGRTRRVVFVDAPDRAAARAARDGRGLLVWGGRDDVPADAGRVLRVEDGFLRSRGLGADLVPPLSLVTDDLGIYYDPAQESRLERMIATPPPPGGTARAARLLAGIVAGGVTKYNLGAPPPELPEGHRILVPGQVEDDAALRLGAGPVGDNLALLRAVRAANPHAAIVYKVHPDVRAGLRPGAIAAGALAGLADAVVEDADPAALIMACDEVWTMTSLLGFEALLRGKPVTCLGAPFYAGWGLTRDLGPVPSRRMRAPDGHPLPRPGLLQLVHAALIAYPRYHDPASGLPCPAEVVAERLRDGRVPSPGPLNRLLAKAQGRLASHAGLWRQ